VQKYAERGQQIRNPDYPSFSGSALRPGGGDCTNFINQALRAGGLAFMRQYERGRGSWWVQERKAYGGHGMVGIGFESTDSWRLTTVMQRHLEEYGLASRIPNGVRDWREGDLIFFNYLGAAGGGHPESSRDASGGCRHPPHAARARLREHQGLSPHCVRLSSP
jgi:hypothetical protein